MASESECRPMTMTAIRASRTKQNRSPLRSGSGATPRPVESSVSATAAASPSYTTKETSRTSPKATVPESGPLWSGPWTGSSRVSGSGRSSPDRCRRRADRPGLGALLPLGETDGDGDPELSDADGDGGGDASGDAESGASVPPGPTCRTGATPCRRPPSSPCRPPCRRLPSLRSGSNPARPCPARRGSVRPPRARTPQRRAAPASVAAGAPRPCGHVGCRLPARRPRLRARARTRTRPRTRTRTRGRLRRGQRQPPRVRVRDPPSGPPPAQGALPRRQHRWSRPRPPPHPGGRRSPPGTYGEVRSMSRTPGRRVRR